jgi:outer membrane protein OmpA-like peptidoglycan-associated protein
VWDSTVAVASTLVACACTPTPPPQAPAPPDLVVLAADPEDGTVGHLTVSRGGSSVELTQANDSTTVGPGGQPTPVVAMDPAEVTRTFGPIVAAQPAAARHFYLYFETGGDTLTPESKALTAEVITTVRGRVAPEVSVIGHTDTTDSPTANYELGLRRAGLIRDLLVQAGLDATLVDVASHGESDLLVPTPDNTAEAKNRRVEVTVR